MMVSWATTEQQPRSGFRDVERLAVGWADIVKVAGCECIRIAQDRDGWLKLRKADDDG